MSPTNYPEFFTQRCRTASAPGRLVIGVALACLCALSYGCDRAEQQRSGFESIATVAELQAHTAEFRRGVEKVTDGVWIAIGYGLANSILIEAEDGLIVVDTMESLREGRSVATEFRKLSDKPLRAIIYTHNHTDHVFGAQSYLDVLADDGIPVEVFAHDTTAGLVDRIVSEYRPIITQRSLRMFGTYLDDAALVNNGIGPRLGVNSDSGFGFVRPTQTFSDSLKTTVAGIDLELVHAPGETDDQLFVWIAERGLLCPGDNLYKTFPNLYTIRGTPYRSLKSWARSIDAMRRLPVEHVAPSHTRPIHGRKEIYDILTDYRDAIRYVYDQTVRHINAGLTPDEIAGRVKLPEHLASSPYLAEFYGTPAWSARSVFAGNLGWFDGNPATLSPLAPNDYARRIAGLAGGVEKLRASLAEAAREKSWQWALELSDLVLRIAPGDKETIATRITALTALGEAASNPNARHYYLTSALELRDGLVIKPITSGSDAMLRALPLDAIFESLAVNLHAENALDLDQKVGFTFTDSGNTWTLWVRRGVVEHHSGLREDLDMHVRTDELKFKKMLSGRRSAALALATDFAFESGGRVALAKFLKLFEPE